MRLGQCSRDFPDESPATCFSPYVSALVQEVPLEVPVPAVAPVLVQPQRLYVAEPKLPRKVHRHAVDEQHVEPEVRRDRVHNATGVREVILQPLVEAGVDTVRAIVPETDRGADANQRAPGAVSVGLFVPRIARGRIDAPMAMVQEP